MSIRLQVTIEDEGALDGSAFVRLVDHVERTCKNTAVTIAIRICNQEGLPSSLTQLVALRIWSSDESLFWIEDVRSGSKILDGKVIAGALIATILTSTIGESIKDGWKQTASHEYISQTIPKIENFFIQEFKQMFDSGRSPVDDKFYIEPVAIRREDRERVLEIRAKQRQAKLFD